MFDNNFGKYGPIFKMVSPVDSTVATTYVYTINLFTSPAICVATLPLEIRKSKNVTDFGSIHSELLTCS